MRSSSNAVPAALLVAALAGAASGCASVPAEVHPRFAELRPETVRIAPVENRTLLDNLERYPTSGLLQRTVFGSAAVDVIAQFAGGARESLEALGYRIAADAGAGADAELRIRILSWRDDPAPQGGGIEADFEVELVRLVSGEVLYRHPAPCSAWIRSDRQGGPRLTAAQIQRGIRRAMAHCLDELPRRAPAGEGP